MRYPGMPAGMWALFVGSFQKKLTDVTMPRLRRSR